MKMKKLSVKLKLTLLYTFFMILAAAAALAILLSLSGREILASTQARLEKRVQDSVDEIETEAGEVNVDPDFYSVTGDVYLSLYDENMYFKYGKIPYGFNSQPEISDGETRRIRESGREWFVYDMSFRLSKEDTVYIRGITSITEAEKSFGVTVRFAAILFPFMTAVTAFIGYRMTRRTLLPVKRITHTVRQIRADADLSRRIGLKGSGEKGGDEIYNLAGTFDEMLEELEEVFKREKQFTSDVSHELRTPISVILAQCRECLTDDSLAEKQRKQLELIEQKAKFMSDMISQLLFLSRAGQGRQPLYKEPINVSELTRMAAEEQQMLADAEGRSVTISCRIEPDLTAYVDETFYIRMVINLISNAVCYGREGGSVIVTLKISDGELLGSVEDNGAGIVENELPYIWDRFYRSDTSRTGAGHAGLGLSMVKWIAQAHGGWVKAESAIGVGSTFSFGLPAESENAFPE